MAPQEIASLGELALSAAMALPRLAAVFSVTPFLSGTLLTPAVRNGLLALLALFLSPSVGEGVPTSHVLLLLIVAKEALIGLLLGLGFGVFVWVLQSVGDLIEFQTGSGNAEFFDPVGGHEGGATGGFLGWLAVTLFVAAGGLPAMFGAVVDSYRLWPVTAFLPDPGRVLLAFTLHEGDMLFLWIAKLCAPVLVVLVIVELGMGLVSRVAPQLNVFVFAQPVKSLLATLMLVLSLSLVHASMLEFMRPSSSVLALLRQWL